MVVQMVEGEGGGDSVGGKGRVSGGGDSGHNVEGGGDNGSDVVVVIMLIISIGITRKAITKEILAKGMIWQAGVVAIASQKKSLEDNFFGSCHMVSRHVNKVRSTKECYPSKPMYVYHDVFLCLLVAPSCRL